MAKRATAAKIDPAPAVENVADNSAFPLALLGAIVNATQNTTAGFIYVQVADAEKLLKLELVEQSTNLFDENGAVATRATDAGIKYMALNTDDAPREVSKSPAFNAPYGGNPASAPVAEKVSTMAFELDDDVPLPNVKRGGAGRTPKYDFDIMQPGQSFHVPATEDNPEPAKSLASTVSSANARYAVETGKMETITVTDWQTDAEGKRVKVNGKYVKVGEHSETVPEMRLTREFVVRTVDEKDKRGKGARIFRLR